MIEYIKKYSLLLTVFMVSSLWATPSEEDELLVYVETESPLLATYIPSIYAEEAGFKSEYLDQLRDVAIFDFSYNGKTRVLPIELTIAAQAKKEGYQHSFDAKFWKTHSVSYVVKILVKQNKLSARVFSTGSDTVKVINDLPLVGELAQDRRRIHQLSDTIFKALFAEDGIATTHILYSKSDRSGRDSSKWASEIWESDYDGFNAHQVTHDGYYCVSPYYLPPQVGHTSGSFFYVSYRLGQPKIFVASLRDGVGRRLTHLSGNQLHPTVSKQRDMVAFIADTGGNPDVFLQSFSPGVGALGKPWQVFTSSGVQGSPTFSPDGKRMAFVSNMDGVPRIYMIYIPKLGQKISGVKPILLTKRNRENTSPSWSPDGTKLAYSSKTRGIRQIWVYDFEEGVEKQLTEGGDNKENPSWASDSFHLIFNAGEPAGLYMINLNQLDPVVVSTGKDDNRFPAWEYRR